MVRSPPPMIATRFQFGWANMPGVHGLSTQAALLHSVQIETLVEPKHFLVLIKITLRGIVPLKDVHMLEGSLS
jgi:hypothetical protein